MDDKLTIFIAVTAAAVVLQMLILAGMFWTMRKLSAFAKQQAEELSSHVLPLVQDTKKLTADVQALLETTRPKLDLILDNVSVVSTAARDQSKKVETSLTAFMDRARLQAIRADELLTRTMDKVEDTSSKVQNTVLSPFRQLNGVLQGIGVGLEAFFQKSRQPKNGKHNDEMFI
jgi:hypothetical protein